MEKKFRILIFSLIFSGALNIGLLSAFIAFAVQDQVSIGSVQKSVSEPSVSNLACLSEMAKLSFRELVSFLTNRELVEEGYSKRDLALAALVAHHHFNLEKAIGSVPQKREVDSIELYPGLSEEQFEAIIRFAYQEKWPLTSKGLFSLLQKMREPTLEQAFLLTPEFFALKVLFQKSGADQDSALLLNLAVEGTWEMLDQFAKEQAQLLDLSVEKRRRLLLSYLAHHSVSAAELLVKTDFAFALKRLDDRGVLDLLSLLKKTQAAESFCAGALQSARSDAIRAVAEKKAREWNVATEVKVEKSARYHTVGEGESLWKIARQYKAKVDDIVLLNGIDKDKLYPGMTLKIPD